MVSIRRFLKYFEAVNNNIIFYFTKAPLTWIYAVTWVAEYDRQVRVVCFTFSTQSDPVVPFCFLSSIATSHISAEWFTFYYDCAANPSTICLYHWKIERFPVTILTHLIVCAKRKKPLTLDYWGQLFQSLYRKVFCLQVCWLWLSQEWKSSS